jgi:hypothetical protein
MCSRFLTACHAVPPKPGPGTPPEVKWAEIQAVCGKQALRAEQTEPDSHAAYEVATSAMGQTRTSRPSCRMSVSPPRADIQRPLRHVCFVPEAVIFHISVFDPKLTADQAADPIPNVS